MKHERGFTLLEVLVALAIFAIIAAAVLVSASNSLRNAARLEDKTLAAWVADNRMTELQLAQPSPELGRQALRVTFAGRQWSVTQHIYNTDISGLQRVSLQVAAYESRPIDGQLFELTGFLQVMP